MIPLRRMKHDPLETLYTWNVRKRWFAEWAVAENEEVGSKLTLSGGNVPALVFFVPGSCQQFVIPKNVGKDAITLCAAA